MNKKYQYRHMFMDDYANQLEQATHVKYEKNLIDLHTASMRIKLCNSIKEMSKLYRIAIEADEDESLRSEEQTLLSAFFAK